MNGESVLNQNLCQTGMVLMLMFGITACDKNNQTDITHIGDDTFQTSSKDDYEPLTGKKLTEVAGQAAIPAGDEFIAQGVTDNELPYVGRYHARVDCKDPVVFCSEGTADFILNLLDDGTAYRIIIHSGKITFASEKQYRQDHWKYDEINHQIILKRESGVEFFYDIDDAKNITMNLDRIANGSEVNKKFFQEGNPFPHEAYKLKREK